MKCKICLNISKKLFNAVIMNKYTIDYFYCSNCGFLQTEEPYWLNEAYIEPINKYDSGYLSRNIYLSKIIPDIIKSFFNPSKKFLDYGGGYGVFVRLLREQNFDFYWYDKYTPNIFAKEFEFSDILKDQIEAVTCFEEFEHFANPLEEIEKIISISRNVIFTTELLPYPIPLPYNWWYYGLEHGQHISFYSENTLRYIAKKYNLIYINYSNLYQMNLHIFLDKR